MCSGLRQRSYFPVSAAPQLLVKAGIPYVGVEGVVVRYRVVGRKCCKIGYEEEVEEELYGVCFVPLTKHKLFHVGAFARVLDPWDKVVLSPL